MDRKYYPGEISFSRNNHNEMHFHIDDANGSRIVDVYMTPEQFGLMISGLSNQECKFALTNLNVVGKKREIKTELVPYSDYRNNEEEMRKALAPFEIDGWKAIKGQLGNHHYRLFVDDTQVYSVNFVRFIDIKEEPHE
jgi:hypothetical protein